MATDTRAVDHQRFLIDEWNKQRIRAGGTPIRKLPDPEVYAAMLAELKRDLKFAQEIVSLIKTLKQTKWVQYTQARMRVDTLKATIARAEAAR